MKKTFSIITGIYILIILSFVAGLFMYSPFSYVIRSFGAKETLYALGLSIETSIIATIAAACTAIPVAYFLTKREFKGKAVIETIIDIPIILPPLIIGLGLLILFGRRLAFLNIVFTKTAIVFAQFFIAAPIMINSMKGVFEQVPEQYENIGLTLGMNRPNVFYKIVLPIARYGILSSVLLGFSRALGEFGATLMVAGATRFRTETMPIAIFLNISSGDFEIAISIALIYIILAAFIFLFIRKFLQKRQIWR